MSCEPGYQSTYAALKRVANTSDGAYEAGYVWCVSFEVPANREEKGVIRGRTAQFKYWLRYGGSSDFSTSMGITSRGYSGALSDWSDSSSSFYWETDDNIEEPTAPISAPSSATQTPSPVERPTTPGGRIQHTGGFSRPLSSDSPIPLRTASYACLSARSWRRLLPHSPAPPWLACSSVQESRPSASACRSRKRKSPVNKPSPGSATLAADPDFFQKARCPHGRTKPLPTSSL